MSHYFLIISTQMPVAWKKTKDTKNTTNEEWKKKFQWIPVHAWQRCMCKQKLHVKSMWFLSFSFCSSLHRPLCFERSEFIFSFAPTNAINGVSWRSAVYLCVCVCVVMWVTAIRILLAATISRTCLLLSLVTHSLRMNWIGYDMSS